MINIVIPMAGAGSRFSNAGFKDPKPLIPVHDTPMIEAVIRNLTPLKQPYKLIFLVQRVHADLYKLHERLPKWSPGCTIIELDGLTQGAACTVLAAKELINTPDHLMIANSDQYIDYPIDQYLAAACAPATDGLIMTMPADDPKWSFVSKDGNDFVTRVVEKQVISNEATVGIYNFRHGADFVKVAEAMIARDERVNGEFYVAPAYNELINAGKKVRTFNIGERKQGMYGLGTPTDLALFLDHPLSHQFQNQAMQP